MDADYSPSVQFPPTRETTVRPRNFAIVGDQAIYTPFSYVDVDCRWTLFATTNEFLQGYRAGRISELDAVIVFSSAAEPLENVILGSASIAGLGISVLYLSSSESDAQAGVEAWSAGGAAETRAVDILPPGTLPKVSFASTQDGAGTILLAMSGTLSRPWTSKELENLQSPRYRSPLPVPTGRRHAETAGDSRRRARITTVVSDKGGVGKTTISLLVGASIAYETYRAGNPQQVLIVDLDRQTQMRELISKSKVGIEKLSASSTKEDVLSNIYYAAAAPECSVPNLSMLLGAPGQAEHLATRNIEFYEYTLGLIQDDFDHIILDASVGVTSDAVTRWAQQISDDVLYVLEADRIQYGKLINLYDSFNKATEDGGLESDLSRLILVENRVVLNDASDEEFYADWDRALERDMPDLVRFAVPEVHPDVRRAFKTDMGLINMPAIHPLMSKAMLPISSFLAGAAMRAGSGIGASPSSRVMAADGEDKAKKKKWGLF